MCVDIAVFGGTVTAASAFIFFALATLPGDQAVMMAGMEATPEQLAVIRAELGTDRPLAQRYVEWVGAAMTGDLGTSALDGRSVSAELAQKLQVTVPLGVLALILSLLIAIPTGVVAAMYNDRIGGRLIGGLSQVAASVPTFVLGLILVVLVALPTRLFPTQGFPADRWEDPAAALRALMLPAIAIAVGQAAVLFRFVRSATLDILQREWVRTALAQGWRLRTILWRQGLRNATLPLLGVIGLEIAGILMGSVIVEQLFALPGVGGMLLSDVSNRDITSLQGALLVLTTLVMFCTMLTNVASHAFDPRLRGRA